MQLKMYWEENICACNKVKYQLDTTMYLSKFP